MSTPRKPSETETLTPREREIALLGEGGMNAATIGKRLGLKPSKVTGYLNAIARKSQEVIRPDQSTPQSCEPSSTLPGRFGL